VTDTAELKFDIACKKEKAENSASENSELIKLLN